MMNQEKLEEKLDRSDEDPAPTAKVETRSGRIIDMNNLPGKTRLNLIMEGEIDADNFPVPSNLPGKRLKVLKEEQRKILKEQMEATKQDVDNPFKVGEMVKYKGDVYEVLKIDAEKGVVISMKNKKGEQKDYWVHHTKVEKG